MVFVYILVALVILLLMIVIHELGHYIAGKILKFKINEFSIGFGPKLFSKKRKSGEIFSLRAIPLGGYCAFEGETEIAEPADPAGDVFADAEAADASGPSDVPATGESRGFLQEKPWKRIIVLLSGGVANLLSAVVFAFIFIWAIGFTVPTVSDLYVDGNGAPFNPLQKGDVIVAVNGTEIGIMKNYDDLIKGVKENDSATVTVERDGQRLDIPITKKHIVADSTNPETGEAETVDYVGFGYASIYEFRDVGFGYALKYCVPYMFKLSWMILGTFGDLIVGKVPLTDLSGPVGTIALMADLSRQNAKNILILLPLIAANLGIFNLLPIPALDGSKVVFTVIEWIRGKPINQKVENMIHTVGIIVLLGLVVVLDLIRFLMPVFT